MGLRAKVAVQPKNDGFIFDKLSDKFLCEMAIPSFKYRVFILANRLTTLKQNRRTRKRDHSGLLAFLILVVVLGGVAFLIASPSGSHMGVQATKAVDAFYGSITNVPFKGQTTGVVKADTNCKPVQNGLTNCIGIINAVDGTELHFNYMHDMSKQPCLATGDRVAITLLSNGTVRVTRG